MKISVVGTGYVGLVSGVCLAAKGHEVLCFDLIQKKIDSIINVLIILTCIEDSRPGSLMLGMIFCIESDVQVENTKILHLDLRK